MNVIVTRAAGQAEPLASRIEALGHHVRLCPLIRVDEVGGEPVDLSRYDWVIVTSPNGAAALTRRARGRAARVAAIGPGTAAALVSRGIVPDLVPHVSTQEGLLAELPLPAGALLARGAGVDVIAESQRGLCRCTDNGAASGAAMGITCLVGLGRGPSALDAHPAVSIGLRRRSARGRHP
jgi:uroporphyrinogen-III synthase